MISLSDIEAAERVLGVRYTDAEREQMVGNLEDQIRLARVSRRSALANSAPTASRFDPRLPTTRMPAPMNRLQLRVAAPQPLPAHDEDIAFASVAELSRWIASRELTSRRLVEIYLSRIATLGDKLECFASIAADNALAEAAAADALTRAGVNLGPLHGIPYGLKDLFDARGTPTGWGAEPFRDRVAENDATIVLKLRAAGAVLLGKTTVGALALDDIWYGGRTRNPWNLNEGSSGSSAGSASATAAGLCAFSIGTETLGSITSPSQRCGTTGLRPTYGRVSRAGAMSLCPTLDKVGPICRTVEDTGIVLSAINGYDPADRASIEAGFSFDANAGIAGLRLGYLPSSFGEGATEIDHAALAAARRLGVEIVETRLPDAPYEALWNILMAEAAAAFEAMTLNDVDDQLKRQDPGAWPNAFRKARFLSAVDHVQLDRHRYRVMLALDELFGRVDALIGPFMTGPMLLASNFTGHPCLHLRAGFTRRTSRAAPASLLGALTIGGAEESGQTFRVPQGISIWGRLFDEATILNLGLALERELGVAWERPTFAA